MTHREKAEVIYKQFYEISPLHIEDKRKADSKKQAIRAVEIIIEELKFLNSMIVGISHTIGFGPKDRIENYMKVKTELLNL
ncbi:MAG: hypothetical protein V4547_18300 [Bacteroidota bacterium]